MSQVKVLGMDEPGVREPGVAETDAEDKFRKRVTQCQGNGGKESAFDAIYIGRQQAQRGSTIT